MTRLLIIGSSHVAAYKNASDTFAAEQPDIDITFFGLRGPLFLTGQIDDKGVFVPPYRDDSDRSLAETTNGQATIDASGYDHVLMVGHRFAFTHFPVLLEDHDILGGMRTDRPRLLSEAMLYDTITSVTQTSVDEAAAAVANLNRRVTFAMAPYPATSITERAPGFELARLLQTFWARPDAAWVTEMWLTALRAALSNHGHHLLEQPEALNDGAFATKPAFASQAAAMAGDTLGKTDHRHMNADFGLAMLRAYADTILGVSEAPNNNDTSKTLNERIA
ncbi:MAG: hypothetical protein ABJL67_14715 [Sulfitobacter sp.]